MSPVERFIYSSIPGRDEEIIVCLFWLIIVLFRNSGYFDIVHEVDIKTMKYSINAILSDIGVLHEDFIFRSHHQRCCRVHCILLLICGGRRRSLSF